MSEQDPESLTHAKDEDARATENVEGPERTTLEPESSPPVSDIVKLWIRRIWVCNPFYLLSAALILFGVVSLADAPRFLSHEVHKLLFSFSTLEIYEALLAGLIIFLARRGVLYDSTLLLVIESMLMFVPLILVTHAAMIERPMTIALAGTAFIFATCRYVAIKKSVPAFRLPPILSVIGATLLTGNLGLPFSFRVIIENGTDRWTFADFWGWKLILPALVLTAHFLPRPRSWGGPAPGRSWLPILILGLWISASAAHFYCVGYISEMPFRLSLLIPVLWTSVWTTRYRLTDFTPSPTILAQRVAATVPCLLPFFCLFDDPVTARVLILLNSIILLGDYWRQGRNEFGLQLLLGSLASSFAIMPVSWWTASGLSVGRPNLIVGAVAGYGWINTVRCVRPEGGIAAALTSAAGLVGLGGEPYVQLALQVSSVVLVAHSIFWKEQKIATGLRIAAAISWSLQSILWVNSGGLTAYYTVSSGAATVLLIHFLARRWKQNATQWWVVGSATCSLLSVPGHFAIEKARSIPAGMWALVGSFVFLGVGTILALQRVRPKTPEN